MNIEDHTIIFAARIPLPPSVNEMYVNNAGRGRGRIKTQLARDFAAVIESMVTLPLAWKPQEGNDFFVLEIALAIISLIHEKSKEVSSLTFALDMHVVFASDRSDLDNRIKSAQDALSEAMGLNDKRVIRLHITKEVRKNIIAYADVVFSVSLETAMSPLEYLSKQR